MSEIAHESAALDECEQGLWNKLRELLAYESTIETSTDEPHRRRALRSLVRAHVRLIEEMLEMTMVLRHTKIGEDDET